MVFPERDIFATALVAVAGVLYVLWATGAAPPGLGSARATGLVVLGLGVAASASAVVPGFDRLVRGDKSYTAGMSLVGVVALIGGVMVLAGAGDAWLGLMTGTMGLLWLVSTVHHAMLASASPGQRHGPGRSGRLVTAREAR